MNERIYSAPPRVPRRESDPVNMLALVVIGLIMACSASILTWVVCR